MSITARSSISQAALRATLQMEQDWPNGKRPPDSMTKERRDHVKDGTIDWNEVLGKNAE